MPNLPDLAITLKNLEIDYHQSRHFTFENNTFEANALNILWLERQLTFVDKNENRLYDVRGLPCHVVNLRGCLKKMQETLSSADRKFLVYASTTTAAMKDLYSIPSTEADHEE